MANLMTKTVRTFAEHDDHICTRCGKPLESWRTGLCGDCLRGTERIKRQVEQGATLYELEVEAEARNAYHKAQAADTGEVQRDRVRNIYFNNDQTVSVYRAGRLRDYRISKPTRARLLRWCRLHSKTQSMSLKCAGFGF